MEEAPNCLVSCSRDIFKALNKGHNASFGYWYRVPVFIRAELDPCFPLRLPGSLCPLAPCVLGYELGGVPCNLARSRHRLDVSGSSVAQSRKTASRTRYNRLISSSNRRQAGFTRL